MTDLREAALDTITYHESRDYCSWQNVEWVVALDRWGVPCFFYNNDEGCERTGNLWFYDDRSLDAATFNDVEAVSLPRGVIKICEFIGFDCSSVVSINE